METPSPCTETTEHCDRMETCSVCWDVDKNWNRQPFVYLSLVCIRGLLWAVLIAGLSLWYYDQHKPEPDPVSFKQHLEGLNLVAENRCIVEPHGCTEGINITSDGAMRLEAITAFPSATSTLMRTEGVYATDDHH